MKNKQRKSESKALKYNGGKPRMSLISSVFLFGLARQLTYGEQKYIKNGKPGSNNWRLGFQWSELIDALERHIHAYKDGQNLDPDSKLPHVDAISACAMFISEHYHRNLGVDDRYKIENLQTNWEYEHEQNEK